MGDTAMNKKAIVMFKIELIVLVVLVIHSLFISVEQQQIFNTKEKDIKEIQAKIQEEKDTKEKLMELEKILDTDEYVEEVAREKLGMVKPGEKVFVDVD